MAVDGRSSVRWVSGIYCALVAVALTGVVHQSPLEFFNAPGTALVIMVPVVLILGRIAGYRPPPLAHSRVLFAGLFAFFSAYSIDRVRHVTFGNWHSGVEPYGFLALVICLWYVTAQRVIVDEKRLVSPERRDARGDKNSRGDSSRKPSVHRERPDRRAIRTHDGCSRRFL